MRRFRPGRRLLSLAIAFLFLSLGLWFIVGRPKAPVDSHEALRVMTYTSFMSAWGPGAEIASKFRQKFGIDVEFIDGGDAGLMLEKLKLFPVDVVIGLDGISLDRARETTKWLHDFEEVEYAPLAFVYRKGEIVPPTSLNDLLDPRFKDAIALEDPRTSTPGLQFLLWVLDEMGEEAGFQYLAKLQKNVQSVSPSWSTAYGGFKKKQSKLVFSYVTSPVYHLIEEKDSAYAAAIFPMGHPSQTEFAGIPAECARCTDAEKFVSFLREPEIATVLMKKNFMMPIDPKITEGTAFADLPPVKSIELKSAPDYLRRRSEIFERWRLLGL